VIAFLKATGLKPKRTSVQAPWQNGISERWVGSCRREILDHVIPLNEAHLRRLIRDYVDYHHEDRIHDALEKDTPDRRQVEPKPTSNSVVISMPASKAASDSSRSRRFRLSLLGTVTWQAEGPAPQGSATETRSLWAVSPAPLLRPAFNPQSG
jgi:hypothetical protein